jgi:hypothetical protein
MNSDRQQRQKTVSLKDEIKRNASYRREQAKSTTDVARASATTPCFTIISDMAISNCTFPDQHMDSTASHNHTSISASSSDSADSHGLAPSPLLPYRHQHYTGSSSAEQSAALETDFTMKYLDFVFPTLFPFYRPNVFETGRSWLLQLLAKSKIAFHSIVSLSCYYFTMALTNADSGESYVGCKILRWKEVEQHTKKCFNNLRTAVSALDLDSNGTPVTKLDKVVTFQSVIQVLIFEMALGKSDPSASHLPPAFALFQHIMADHNPSTQVQYQSRLASVLLEIGLPLWTNVGPNSHIWSPDQAGFRFCVGYLIYIDVIASTIVQRTPELIHYHNDILAQVDDGTSSVSEAEVRLSGIVGCRNCVIKLIAAISALNAWKSKCVEANSLPTEELLDRSAIISNQLNSCILEMATKTASTTSDQKQYTAFNMRPDPSVSSTPTLIWAYAARLYLATVVTGWQLFNTEIRADVAQIITLVHTVPPHQLRALAWPLCVAGCLALQSEEMSFMKLLSTQGRVGMAGALDDSRQIMQKMWQIRATLDVSRWDLASCFSVLGSPVLVA